MRELEAELLYVKTFSRGNKNCQSGVTCEDDIRDAKFKVP